MPQRETDPHEPHERPADDALDRVFFRYLERPRRRRLAALVRAFHPRLRALALRVTRHGDDADDVCQDVFLALLLDPPAAGSVRSPGGWLASRVLTVARRRRQSAERRRRREVVAAARLSAQEGLDEDDARAIADAIERLPERLRHAVELRYLAGLRNREIAAALGISERSVERDLQQGRDALRERLGATLAVALAAWAASPLADAASASSREALRRLLEIVRSGEALRPGVAARGTSVTLARLTWVAAVALVAVLSLLVWRPWPDDSGAEQSPERVAAAPPVESAGGDSSATREEAARLRTAISPTLANESDGVALRISGWVVDTAGRPIEGARVDAFLTPSLAERQREPIVPLGEALSAADGVFAIDALVSASVRDAARSSHGARNETVSLVAERDGFALGWSRQSVSLAAPPSATTPTPACELPRAQIVLASDTAALTGRIVDPAGAPIAGATVRAALRGSPFETTLSFDAIAPEHGVDVTDGEGLFEITRLGANELFDLVIVHDAYLAERVRHVVPGAPPVDYVLEPARLVAGRVVDHSGAAVSGARVTFSESALQRWGGVRSDYRETRTDADGAFRCALAPLVYEVEVDAPAAHPVPPAVTIDAAAPLEPMRITLPRPGVVEGVVRDASGAPIERAEALVSGEWGTLRLSTDAAGAFRGVVAEGPVEVDVRPPSRQGWWTTSDARVEGVAAHGEPLRCEFTLERREIPDRSEQAAHRRATLRGRVVDPNGLPLVAVVALRRFVRSPGFRVTGRETHTDLDGRFELTVDLDRLARENPAARATIALEAAAPGRGLAKGVLLETVPDDDIDVVLEPCGATRIEGVVRSSRGDIVPHAALVVSRHIDDVFRGVRSVVVGAEGRFVMNDLLPHARYALTPVVAGRYSAYTSVEAVPGEPAEVEIVFQEPDATLEGRVVDLDGRGLSGLLVHYDFDQDELPGGRTAFTDDEGALHVPHVFPGRYHVVIDNEGHSFFMDHVETGGPPFAVTLAPTRRLALRAVDANGLPVRCLDVRGTAEDYPMERRSERSSDGHYSIEAPVTETMLLLRPCYTADDAPRVEVPLGELPPGDADLGTVQVEGAAGGDAGPR